MREYDTRSEPRPIRGHRDAFPFLQRVARHLAAAAPGIEGDGRLAELALALCVDPDAHAEALDMALVVRLARERGLANPLPQTVWVGGGSLEESHAVLSAQAAGVLAQYESTHYGLAAAQGSAGWCLMMVLERRTVELAPVPRTLAAAGELVIDARLLTPFNSPALFVTRPDGSTANAAHAATGTTLRHTLALGEGTWGIEVMGTGPRGPTVLANLVVDVGTPTRVAAPKAVQPLPTSLAEFSQQLEALIAAQRASASLGAVTREAELDALALAHSTDMRDHSFFGHVSPTTGSFNERFVRSGAAGWNSMENIARGHSPAEVHTGLMSSPAHRSALMSPKSNRLGLGVAERFEGGRHVYLVTEVFVRAPEPIDQAREAEEGVQRVNAARVERGREILVLDAHLMDAAARVAQRLFAHVDADPSVLLQAGVRGVRVPAGLRQLGARLVFGALPSGIELSDELIDEKTRWVGFGAAAGNHPKTGPNGIVTVVVFGQ